MRTMNVNIAFIAIGAVVVFLATPPVVGQTGRITTTAADRTLLGEYEVMFRNWDTVTELSDYPVLVKGFYTTDPGVIVVVIIKKKVALVSKDINSLQVITDEKYIGYVRSNFEIVPIKYKKSDGINFIYNAIDTKKSANVNALLIFYPVTDGVASILGGVNDVLSGLLGPLLNLLGDLLGGILGGLSNALGSVSFG